MLLSENKHYCHKWKRINTVFYKMCVQSNLLGLLKKLKMMEERS
jgi:hypothetical protein